MKKFLALLGVMSLGLTSAATVVACGNTNEENIGDKEKQELNLAIKNTELGEILAKDIAHPTAAEILAGLLLTTENEAVKTEELMVELIESNFATIKVKPESKLYQEADVIVHYKTVLDEREDLLSIFSQDISRIVSPVYADSEDLIPTEWELLIAILLWYPPFRERDIILSNITANSATVTASKLSRRYSGSMTVNFDPIPDTRPDISRLIPEEDRDLGTFSINSAIPSSTDFFAKLAPNIVSRVVRINEITATSAILRTTVNSPDKGEVVLTYTVDDTRTELSEAIDKTDLDLGQISTGGIIPLASEILNLEKLSVIKDDVFVLNITETGAIIKAKSNSEVYKGEVVLNYTVNDTRTELSEAVENKDLGIISPSGDELSEADILEVLKTKNPEIKTDELVVFLDEVSNSATIGLSPYARTYKGNDIIVTYQL